MPKFEQEPTAQEYDQWTDLVDQLGETRFSALLMQTRDRLGIPETTALDTKTQLAEITKQIAINQQARTTRPNMSEAQIVAPKLDAALVLTKLQNEYNESDWQEGGPLEKYGKTYPPEARKLIQKFAAAEYALRVFGFSPKNGDNWYDIQAQTYRAVDKRHRANIPYVRNALIEVVKKRIAENKD